MTDKIIIDGAAKESTLPELDDSLPCPNCKPPNDLFIGVASGLYGGGGIGVYTYCEVCGTIISKTCESETE